MFREKTQQDAALLINRNDKVLENSFKSHMLYYFKKYGIHYKVQIFLSFISILLAAASVINGGYALKMIIEEGVQEHSFYTLPLLSFILSIIVLAFASFGRSFYVSWIGERFTTDLRQDLFNHLIHLDINFFESMKAGEVIARLTTDLNLIQIFIGNSIGILIRNIFLFIGATALMIISAPTLFMFSIIGILFIVVPIVFVGKYIKKLTVDVAEEQSKTVTLLDEVFNSIKTVQSFARENYFKSLFSKTNQLSFKMQEKRLRVRSTLVMMVILLLSCFVGTIIYLGLFYVKSGEISQGDLVSFIYFTIIVSSTFSSFSELITDMQKAAFALDRLKKIEDQTASLFELPVCKALPSPFRGIVAIHNVSFAYPSNPDNKVLDGITLSLSPGEKLAIVGPSGSGKSTLLSLLLRFYDPQSGMIYLDGINLKELSLHQLRESVAIVPQEPDIFSISVFDNIVYGSLNATRDDIEQAISALQIDEIVKNLPHGYDTLVGNRGVRLSGGQKQRIIIARALLKKPKLLLLDEATSHLDAVSEDLIQKCLGKMMKTCTSIVVAHRLSTVLTADRIAVLHNGKLDSIGTHAELITEDGLYRKLASLQFQNLDR
ncbi:MAG: ATP-binding cassette domain-containing protein [Proteobacteria bacterium]|nr:ATP-binding cassette domain-containing protein [Pseudomonadota bacterium]